MTPEAFVLLVATTTASLGVPVPATVGQPPAARYTLDLQRSTTDSFAILKFEPPNVELLPLAVGALPIRLYWNVEGVKEPVAGAPLTLYVAEPPMESPELADIKPPLRARPLWWPWLLAAVAAAAAYYYWRKRRARAELESVLEAARDTRPPHERALEQFDALEALWNEGRRREFYFGLTDALREYLEPRFELPATRQTTAELLRALKRSGLDRKLWLRLQSLLERADLVKFADARPEDAWGPADLAAARAYVQDTAIVPATAPPSTEAPR